MDHKWTIVQQGLKRAVKTPKAQKLPNLSYRLRHRFGWKLFTLLIHILMVWLHRLLLVSSSQICQKQANPSLLLANQNKVAKGCDYIGLCEGGYWVYQLLELEKDYDYGDGNRGYVTNTICTCLQNSIGVVLNEIWNCEYQGYSEYEQLSINCRLFQNISWKFTVFWNLWDMSAEYIAPSRSD